MAPANLCRGCRPDGSSIFATGEVPKADDANAGYANCNLDVAQVAGEGGLLSETHQVSIQKLEWSLYTDHWLLLPLVSKRTEI